MFRKKIDFDEELDKLARKANVKIRKTEYTYDNQFKKLDLEIDSVLDKKNKTFDDVNKIRENYNNISHDNTFVEQYREKLKRI